MLSSRRFSFIIFNKKLWSWVYDSVMLFPPFFTVCKFSMKYVLEWICQHDQWISCRSAPETGSGDVLVFSDRLAEMCCAVRGTDTAIFINGFMKDPHSGAVVCDIKPLFSSAFDILVLVKQKSSCWAGLQLDSTVCCLEAKWSFMFTTQTHLKAASLTLNTTLVCFFGRHQSCLICDVLMFCCWLSSSCLQTRNRTTESQTLC